MSVGKFWDVDFVENGRVMRGILRERFPDTHQLLSETLERIDVEDLVYPDNSDEYSDVVAEILVLMAWHGNSLQAMHRDDLDLLIRMSFARCFPDEDLDDEVECGRREQRLARVIDSIDQARFTLVDNGQMPRKAGRPGQSNVGTAEFSPTGRLN